MCKNALIETHDGDLVVGTWDLSVGFGMEHRRVKLLFSKYKLEFEELGAITFQRQKPRDTKGGGVIKEFLLNEPQATYLTTLFSNNEKVRKFKIKLTKMFFIQRKLLMSLALDKQNAEWLEKRSAGKLDRRLETDSIKEFIEYAKSQGSKNASKYYMILTKMENSCLVSLEILKSECENIRNVVDMFSLSALQIADVMVSKAIKEGMEKKTYYKDIYIDARTRVENLALSIGRTPLRLMNQEGSITLREPTG